MGARHAASGGVASYTKNLVENIPFQGRVTVLCDVLDMPCEYTEGRVRVRRVFRRGAFSVVTLFRALWSEKADVVHFQQELHLYGGPFSALLLQFLILFVRLRSKVVVTLHGVVDLQKVDASFVRENNSALPAWIVRTAMRLIYVPLGWYAHHLVVHEALFKNILVTQYFQSPQKVSVIQHGVEMRERVHREYAREKTRLPHDAFVVLFMGYLTGYKGIDTLIEGFGLFAKEHPHVFLVIGAGKHPKLHNDPQYCNEYKRLEEKAAQHISSDAYTWRGFIEEEDIAHYYSAADVAVYPYTIQMSSSGPMALSIAFSNPFLVSTAFASIADPRAVFGSTPSELARSLAQCRTEDLLSGLGVYVAEKRRALSWEVIGKRYDDLYRTL